MPGPHRRSCLGFTLIELLIVVAIIGILAAIAIPGLLWARVASNESSAIGSLRAINSGQATYSATAAQGGFAVNLPTLGVSCGAAGTPFLSEDLTTAVTVLKSGFEVNLGQPQAPPANNVGPLDCNGTASQMSYYATAVPRAVGVSGNRAFATNHVATIWQDTSGVAPSEPFTITATSSPIR